MSDDIDSFIEQQKSKLARERFLLEDTKPRRSNQLEENYGRNFKENIPPNKPETPEQPLVSRMRRPEEEKRQMLREERKREYNEFLRQQNMRQRNADSENREGLLPRFHERDSAKERERKIAERNREYNDYLRTRLSNPEDFDANRMPVKNGWTAPLDLPSNKPRRTDDYDDDPPALRGAPIYNLDDRKFNSLDKEYENRRVKFQTDVQASLDDDDDLIKKILDPLTRQRNTIPKSNSTNTKLYDASFASALNDATTNNNKNSKYKDTRDRSRSQPRLLNNDDDDSLRRRARSLSRDRPGYEGPSEYVPSLPIGSESQSKAQQKKEAYRNALLQQMRENDELRKREKKEELRVHATGALDVFRRPDRMALPDKEDSRFNRDDEQRLHKPRVVKDNTSPRMLLFDDNPPVERYRPSVKIRIPSPEPQYNNELEPPPRSERFMRRYGGILENGWDVGPELPRYGDDKWTDPYPMQTTHSPIGNTRNYHNQQHAPATSTAATYAQPYRSYDNRPDATAAMPKSNIQSEEREKLMRDKNQKYREDLARQMEEQKVKKEREKLERERYEKKLDEEIRNYNPYGRGGGGAPLKDAQGNLISDLRSMNMDNQATLVEPAKKKQLMTTVYEPTPIEVHLTARDDGEASHARGGHGIFGTPISDQQKNARTKYQEDLRIQMEEKKRLQELEREKERQEEEKFMRKVEEDRLQMLREAEEEKRKAKAKEEAAEREREARQRELEERKRQEEEEKRKREAERAMQEEQRRREEEQRKQREKEREREAAAAKRNARGKSPPVPAVRTKTLDLSHRSPSPSVTQPTPQARAQSADVLRQLEKMRAKLQSEKDRVQTDIGWDEERSKRSAPVRGNADIFDMAINKEANRVNRTRDVDSGVLREFNDLKSKGRSQSRHAFRTMFPDNPVSPSDLDSQQLALLQHQHAILANQPNFKREGSQGSVALESDSAFIAVPHDELNEKKPLNYRPPSSSRRRRPNKFIDTPLLNSPAVSRMGSTTSLNPDKISQRNEDRLRKLKSLAGDDISLGDPDDVLDRFMSQQKHKRPPSNTTLQDDTWLRPAVQPVTNR